MRWWCLWPLTVNYLDGLEDMSALNAGGLGLESWANHTSELKTGILVVLLGQCWDLFTACQCTVTCWSNTFNLQLHLAVAACKIFWTGLSLTYPLPVGEMFNTQETRNSSSLSVDCWCELCCSFAVRRMTSVSLEPATLWLTMLVTFDINVSDTCQCSKLSGAFYLHIFILKSNAGSKATLSLSIHTAEPTIDVLMLSFQMRVHTDVCAHACMI